MKTSDKACPFCEVVSAKTRRSHIIRTGEDALVYLTPFRDMRQEFLVVLSLDSAGHLIKRRIITMGLLDAAFAHPREVFAGALEDRAKSIILAHNHPSGIASPSEEDITTTQQLIAAGQILSVPIRDHVVITDRGHFSFKKHHLL
jgi:DNA repair protein RadC